MRAAAFRTYVSGFFALRLGKEAIMARRVLTVMLVVLPYTMVGCKNLDSGRGRILPPQTSPSVGSTAILEVATKGEMDLVEQAVTYRQAYRKGLEVLAEYYEKTGNNMKLRWARKELVELNTIAQYKYIIEAEVAGPNLKASTAITAADLHYREAVQVEKEAGRFIFRKDADLLHLALDKYDQVIAKYPSSDKIDDAAYRAGKIYEHFKDYTIALLYFQRTYQWDNETVYPARFRAAYILDKRLHRRAEALQLYQEALQSVKKEGEHREWVEYAERRVKQLTKSIEE